MQSSEQTGVFLDGRCSFCNRLNIYVDVFEDFQAQFDFTQHTREDCDGECWKLVDVIDTRRFDNHTGNRSLSLSKYASISKLKSSRRCFSANEFVRAAEISVNTSDGCRQVKKDHKKMKEICFCSDQNMSNNAFTLINNLFIIFFLYIFK